MYLPENQYGLVHLGDRAKVTVDSFPGQHLCGTVQFIADQAQFTPHNVQTPLAGHDCICHQAGAWRTRRTSSSPACRRR